MTLPEELCKIADRARQPIAFKKFYYKYVLNPKSTYYWTEKTDGLRAVLIVSDGCLYRRQKKDYILIDDAFPSQDTLVLDSELYEDKYYIFDCYYLNGEIAGEEFEERYGRMSEWVEALAYPDFCRKVFHPIHDLHDINEASKLLSLETSPISGNRIDGVIIQSNLGIARAAQYKWKRERLITTDFYLRYDTDRRAYLLYVMGDEKYCHPLREISRNHSIVINDVTLRPISIPIRENIHIFTPRENFDPEGYFQKEVDEINRLMALALSEPEKLDGKIVEMSPAADGWVPLRIRDDKMVPNGYHIAFDNILTYYEFPAFFEEKEQYYEAAGNNEETTLVHDISHIMRDCQFEHLAGYVPENAGSILDIGSGRGGDYERLVNMGFTCIFGIDDIYNCAKYSIRAHRRGMTCNLNLIPGLIGPDNGAIAEDIRGRAEYPTEGFPVFNMDYAVHYLLDIPDGLEILRDFVRSFARKDAVFIITAFDGDQMIEDAKKQNPLQLGDLSIDIDVEHETAKMLLPTIKKEEVTERLFTGKDLERLGFTLLDSFYPLREKEDAFDENDRAHGLFQYYRYMRAYILSVWD